MLIDSIKYSQRISGIQIMSRFQGIHMPLRAEYFYGYLHRHIGNIAVVLFVTGEHNA